MDDASRRRGLTPTERLVLIRLAKHDGPGRCRVQQSTIAEDLELSRRTVERAIATLKSKGLIEVLRSRRTAYTRVRYSWERQLRSDTSVRSRSDTSVRSKEKAPQEESENGAAETADRTAVPRGTAHCSAGPEAVARSSPSPAPPEQRRLALLGLARSPDKWLTGGLMKKVGPVPQLPTEGKEHDESE